MDGVNEEDSLTMNSNTLTTSNSPIKPKAFPPNQSGYVSVTTDVRLYYEIRSSSTPAATKLIMIMGAFATLKHFDELAQFVVDTLSTSIEVLTYDHRGMGRSVPCSQKMKQTPRLLAQDALSLINQVWGTTSKVHVHGASLGGMVAQELALLLIAEKRLLSLYLAVTSRGSYLKPMAFLGSGTWSLLMPFLIKSNKERMVRDVLIPSTFTPGTPSCEFYARLWNDEYEQWFSFHDREACACQCSVVGTHYLTDNGARLIRDSNVPITVQISLKDKLMAPKKQQELAKILKAKTVMSDQGHMGDNEVKQEIFETVLKHLEEAVQHLPD
ncbi:unnamed protein product [Didymodactylos carnosus]|uniref:AB hydrolase-1 domain-containing protein n=1 Tax=Didymodactylos carnosus TaxID=1234261 RepID=A0A814KEG0_9BILA|nr:unnamed protein product [Didymodactylos carnosus]CAF1050273.1 unnamed protein product [Didymodactylos carnosus]CAF3657594.1 unnamed protein product [Didymodactylos carnosus]CAF3819837.1 unnamed protein product [Didymodactylos carnosus]